MNGIFVMKLFRKVQVTQYSIYWFVHTIIIILWTDISTNISHSPNPENPGLSLNNFGVIVIPTFALGNMRKTHVLENVFIAYHTFQFC